MRAINQAEAPPPLREFSVNGRAHIENRCERCGDVYVQQKRLWVKVVWKSRCSKCRGEFRQNICLGCGKTVSRGYTQCKSCARKYDRPACIDCGKQIHLGSTRCLSCHNKLQDRGLSKERVKFQVSKKWAKVRQLCFERDNFTCQECNQRGGEINAHHVLNWASYPDLRLALGNVITVCRPCHEKIHWGQP